MNSSNPDLPQHDVGQPRSLPPKLAANLETILGVASLTFEWANARKAFLALPPNSPDARAALNRLANAEDALFKAATK